MPSGFFMLGGLFVRQAADHGRAGQRTLGVADAAVVAVHGTDAVFAVVGALDGLLGAVIVAGAAADTSIGDVVGQGRGCLTAEAEAQAAHHVVAVEVQDLTVKDQL